MQWVIALTPGALKELPERVKHERLAAATNWTGEPSDLVDGDIDTAVKLAQLAAKQLGAGPDSNVTVAMNGHSNPKRGGSLVTPRDHLAVSVSLADTPPAP